MSELELDVCQAGEVVYLTLGQISGEASSPAAGPEWLVLDDCLSIQVTRHAGLQNRPLIVRLPAGDLPRTVEGAVGITTARLVTCDGAKPLTPVVRSLGSGERVKGHIASVQGGAITGWATDPTQPMKELPIEVDFPDRTLIGMTNGQWHGTEPRAFAVPLPTDLPERRPVLVIVRAMLGGTPFARAPLYLTPTPAGWLMATPIRRQGTVLEGEFLLASAPKKPVSVALKTASGQVFRAECSLPSDVRFGARPCGFRFDGMVEKRLDTARLLITHDLLDPTGLDFDMDAFRPVPDRDAFQITTA